jgi:hypothetical protein
MLEYEYRTSKEATSPTRSHNATEQQKKNAKHTAKHVEFAFLISVQKLTSKNNKQTKKNQKRKKKSRAQK